MVLDDIFQDSEIQKNRPPNQNSAYQQDAHPAPALDRILAALFDLLLLAPFVSLLSGLLTKQLNIHDWTALNSQETQQVFIILAAFWILTSSFFLAALVVFRGGTPGQKVFKIKMISLLPEQNKSKLSFNAVFIRYLLRPLHFLFFGLSLLEVFSHPLRRAFHDRLTETMLCTEKKNMAADPNSQSHQLRIQLFAEERRLFGRVLTNLFLFLLIFILAHLKIKMEKIAQGQYVLNSLSSETYLCPDVLSFVKQETTQFARLEQRLDLATGLFLLGDISSDCFSQELAVLERRLSPRPELNFASWLLSPQGSELKKNYQSLICEIKDSAPCLWTQLVGVKPFEKFNFASFHSLSSEARITPWILFLREKLNYVNLPAATNGPSSFLLERGFLEDIFKNTNLQHLKSHNLTQIEALLLLAQKQTSIQPHLKKGRQQKGVKGAEEKSPFSLDFTHGGFKNLLEKKESLEAQISLCGKEISLFGCSYSRNCNSALDEIKKHPDLASKANHTQAIVAMASCRGNLQYINELAPQLNPEWRDFISAAFASAEVEQKNNRLSQAFTLSSYSQAQRWEALRALFLTDTEFLNANMVAALVQDFLLSPSTSPQGFSWIREFYSFGEMGLASLRSALLSEQKIPVGSSEKDWLLKEFDLSRSEKVREKKAQELRGPAGSSIELKPALDRMRSEAQSFTNPSLEGSSPAPTPVQESAP